MPTASHDPSLPAAEAGVGDTAVVGHALSSTVPPVEDIAARLQTWNARGLHAFDPLAVRTIEAMLGRAAALDDRVRMVVEAKALQRLDTAVAKFEASTTGQASEDKIAPASVAQRHAFSSSSSGSAPQAAPRAAVSLDAAPLAAVSLDAAPPLAAVYVDAAVAPLRSPPDSPPGSPLRDLLDYIASQQGLIDRPAASAQASASARAELKALTYFQSTWAALSVDRRLRQSLSALPENAGPLNSQRLVHRALEAMRELSPAYLDRFIEHVDTLLWLDDASGGLPLSGKAVLHVEADKPARKRPRRKPG